MPSIINSRVSTGYAIPRSVFLILWNEDSPFAPSTHKRLELYSTSGVVAPQRTGAQVFCYIRADGNIETPTSISSQTMTVGTATLGATTSSIPSSVVVSNSLADLIAEASQQGQTVNLVAPVARARATTSTLTPETRI